MGDVIGEIATKRRRLRADSVRNRERLLDAAAEIFGAAGSQASLDSVARHAGVGIGTLYRHFPTREALFEAVYRHEVDHLTALARQLAVKDDRVEALRTWLHANVRLVAAKKGMVEALQLAAHGSSELKAYSFAQMTSALALLLDGAVEAGAIRNDIGPEDLLRTLAGIFYSQSTPNWQQATLRLVDVFVDGLRLRKEARRW